MQRETGTRATPKLASRREFLRLAVAGAAGAVALAACSPSALGTLAPPTPSVPARAETQPTPSQPTPTAALAPIQASAVLTMYVGNGPWERGLDDWARQFRAEAGVQLQHVSGAGPALRQSIAAESAAASDLFLGAPGDAFALSADDYLAMLPWDQLSSAKDVDERFRFDKVGVWGYDLWEIAYSPRLLGAPDVPRKWLDLASDKYKGRLVMPVPDSDSASATRMALQGAYGDTRASEVLSGFYANAARLTAGPDEGERAMTAGTQAASPLAMVGVLTAAEQAGGSVVGQPPEDGVLMILNSIGVMKAAPNRDSALKFLDFFLGPPIQNSVMNELEVGLATNGKVTPTKESITRVGLGGQTVEQVLKTAHVPNWDDWCPNALGNSVLKIERWSPA